MKTVDWIEIIWTGISLAGLYAVVINYAFARRAVAALTPKDPEEIQTAIKRRRGRQRNNLIAVSLMASVGLAAMTAPTPPQPYTLVRLVSIIGLICMQLLIVANSHNELHERRARSTHERGKQ